MLKASTGAGFKRLRPPRNNLTDSPFMWAAPPLDVAELQDLKRRLLRGQPTRTLKLYEVYNGPCTRAKTAKLARRAMEDMQRMGMACMAHGGQWTVYAS